MMSSRKINNKLDDMFHGTTTLMSHVHMAVKGHSPIYRMFKSLVIETIADGVGNPSILVVNRSHFYWKKILSLITICPRLRLKINQELNRLV
jgi:hypothetical protein